MGSGQAEAACRQSEGRNCSSFLFCFCFFGAGRPLAAGAPRSKEAASTLPQQKIMQNGLTNFRICVK